MLDEFANDCEQRLYDPSKIAALDVCAEHARRRRADDDACACALPGKMGLLGTPRQDRVYLLEQCLKFKKS